MMMMIDNDRGLGGGGFLMRKDWGFEQEVSFTFQPHEIRDQMSPDVSSGLVLCVFVTNK